MDQNKLSIDEYISGFPSEVQDKLQQIRACISQAAPEASECINYGIPTFTLEGNLVHFAGIKKHIGFYPAPSGIIAFKDELEAYESSKGAVQFPLDQPIPLELIEKIVRFRVNENKEIAIRKKQKRKCKNGHTYYKSSDCPTCPVCESESKPKEDFLSAFSAPARRALQSAGILNVRQLAEYTQKSILALHGMGPGSLPAMKKALEEAGLNFKEI
jgi:uncharacterized protein YdhG (YjbR/CyaY superfamily)